MQLFIWTNKCICIAFIPVHVYTNIDHHYITSPPQQAPENCNYLQDVFVAYIQPGHAIGTVNGYWFQSKLL